MDRIIQMRFKWVKLYENIQDAGFVCRRCGISRPTLRKWYRRYKELGIEGLKDLSKRPNNSPNLKITEELKKVVHIPVVSKITPTAPKMAEVATACQEGGADGISLFGGTSLAAPPVDIYNRDTLWFLRIRGCCPRIRIRGCCPRIRIRGCCLHITSSATL